MKQMGTVFKRIGAISFVMVFVTMAYMFLFTPSEKWPDISLYIWLFAGLIFIGSFGGIALSGAKSPKTKNGVAAISTVISLGQTGVFINH